MSALGPPESSGRIEDGQLPLEVVSGANRSTGSSPTTKDCKPLLPKYLLLALIPLILFTGGVIGIYVQPPALRAFLRLTGLKPGGGTNNPIAVPVEVSAAEPAQQLSIRSVVALGRLVPDGKVITISPPYGAGDARIEEVKVAIGQHVERGETVALLDNNQSLEAAVGSAEANVALQRATLEQTRRSISASYEEARATLERAQTGAQLATQDFHRQQELYKKGAGVQAELDQAAAALAQAQRDVAKAEATVSRFESQQVEDQPDVIVAARKLDAAIADLNRARHDLARGIVTAPVSGTILDIFVRPGEKPGGKGILEIGNTQRMTAELEVYQAEIGRVAIGQLVELTADPLDGPLHGMVSEIGYAVERQTVMRDDPAANADARVVKVIVSLDHESSTRAAKLTNLEVTGRIAVEDQQ